MIPFLSFLPISSHRPNPQSFPHFGRKINNSEKGRKGERQKDKKTTKSIIRNKTQNYSVLFLAVRRRIAFAYTSYHHAIFPVSLPPQSLLPSSSNCSSASASKLSKNGAALMSIAVSLVQARHEQEMRSTTWKSKNVIVQEHKKKEGKGGIRLTTINRVELHIDLI